MAKLWNRCLIKVKLLCLAVIILAVACNIVIGLFANRLIESANKNFFKPIGVQWIYYLPPNFIFLRNLSIYENNSSPGEEIIALPTVRINLSLWRLITEKRFYILSINCLRPAAQHYDFMRFIGSNLEQILEFFRGLPLQDIRLCLQEAALGFSNKNPKENLEFNLTLNIRARSLYAKGFLRKVVYLSGSKKQSKSNKLAKTLPLRYALEGTLTSGGLSFKKMQISGQNLRCELEGKTNGSVAELKGLIFANTTAKETAFEHFSLSESLQSLYLKPLQWGEPESIGLAGANLSIFNIDARIKFDYPRIELERLNLLVNANPVELKGAANIAKPFSFDFSLNSRFKSMEGITNTSTKVISLLVYANTQDNKLVANGALNIDFLDRKKDYFPLEKFQLVFKDLKIGINESLLKTLTNELYLFCKTDTSGYRIILDDLDMQIVRLKDASKLLNFRSRFYGGALNGKALISLESFTPLIKAEVEVNNADANELDGILVHFSKVYGGISSRMHFLNSPRMVLEGDMHIENGYLNDFEFFKWLAEVFVLPSLRRVNFKRASSDFLVSENGAELRNMRLDSEDLKLEGYFKLGAGDLTSSKMSLLFSYGLLSESPKFAPLLKVLQKELDLIAFDFQLAGNLYRMNFKWLQSDFKDRVQKAIPNFIERKIERNIEEFIEGLGQGS